jgi:hypothetical protein
VTELPSVLQATRPLLLHNPEHRDFPYTLSGTAFILVWRRYHYVATAKHSVRGRPRHEVLVLALENSRTLLRLVSSAWPKGETRDIFDLIVYRVEDPPAGLDAIFVGHEKPEALRPFVPGEPLLISGYPGESKYIDFDSAELRTGRAFMDAVYFGTTKPAEPAHHRIRWTDAAGVVSVEGMSGGPVLRPVEDGDYELVGVLTQGGPTAAPAHFVDVRVLREVLDLDFDNNPHGVAT